MKKKIVCALAAGMVLCFAGCGAAKEQPVEDVPVESEAREQDGTADASGTAAAATSDKSDGGDLFEGMTDFEKEILNADPSLKTNVSANWSRGHFNYDMVQTSELEWRSDWKVDSAKFENFCFSIGETSISPEQGIAGFLDAGFYPVSETDLTTPLTEEEFIASDKDIKEDGTATGDYLAIVRYDYPDESYLVLNLGVLFDEAYAGQNWKDVPLAMVEVKAQKSAVEGRRWTDWALVMDGLTASAGDYYRDAVTAVNEPYEAGANRAGEAFVSWTSYPEDGNKLLFRLYYDESFLIRFNWYKG